VNLARFDVLSEEGRMRPAGVAAFEARGAERVYSHERTEDARLDAAEEAAFRGATGGWEYFQAQAPSYRKATGAPHPAGAAGPTGRGTSATPAWRQAAASPRRS